MKSYVYDSSASAARKEGEEGEEGCGAGGQRKGYLIAAGVAGLAFHLLNARLRRRTIRGNHNAKESEAEYSRVYADRPPRSASTFIAFFHTLRSPWEGVGSRAAVMQQRRVCGFRGWTGLGMLPRRWPSSLAWSSSRSRFDISLRCDQEGPRSMRAPNSRRAVNPIFHGSGTHT